ncbi:MAG: hypothetical protein JXA54_00110 [Candidatus Heimdallarchaeota archaeon]|nr:hypothetical protein [Candidatus Heimdallarchaeota archaeon]
MEEANEIYDSLEQACIQGEIVVVEQYLLKLEELVKKNKEINEVYTKAIAKTLEIFGEKISSLTVKKYLSTIELIIQGNPGDEYLARYYSKILLSSLLAMKSKGQPEIMSTIINNLENLANNHPDTIAIYEDLSSASHEIVNYWKARGDFKALRERTQKSRKLVEMFPDNEKIKLDLSKSLILEIDSTKKSDINNINNLLLEIQQLSEATPTNTGLQLEWVHAYRTAMDRGLEKSEDTKKWLDSMKKIVENKEDDVFKLELAKGYLNVIANLNNQNKEELENYLKEIELLADTNKNNQEIQIIFAQSLFISLQRIGISDMNEVNNIMKELNELDTNLPKNTVIMKIYLESLIGIISLLAQDQKANEITFFIEMFEIFNKKYPEDILIQQTYNQLLDMLKMLGFKKKSPVKKSRLDYL